jgi:hypothetical protein
VTGAPSIKNKRLCIHGHFYQPPRENPWTGDVDPEESARPYRDWNSRIAQECYGPNAACPLIGEDGRIAGMAANYERISFNFGPTLLSWLETAQPRLYGAVVAAGANAVAQPYYHAILPLETAADKRTLLRWGLDDFRRRFAREAAGVWLPETAVDEETLECLVAAGVRFTILAPSQCARVRPAGGGDADWKAVDEKTLLPTRPYRWLSKRAPDRHLALFFFHEGLHESVVKGDAFARPDTLFKKAFGRTRPDDSMEFVHVATDGEFYGHHHRAGAGMLGQTLLLAAEAGLEPTTPARLLDAFPPPQEAEIRPRSAWSCPHGLGRWTEDCGCRTPAGKSWSQAWRGPLREALDWLGGELSRVYEDQAGLYFKDFKETLDRYSERMADRRPETARRFLEKECHGHLDGERTTAALRLLEMQRHRLASKTSCGWFFDDVSGVESALCLAHAARAIELAAAFGRDLTQEFRGKLSRAPSNVKAFKDAAGVYDKLVLPQRVDAARLAAHWAILSHLMPGLESVPSGWRVEASATERTQRKIGEGRTRSLSAVRLRLLDLATLETIERTAVVHRKDRLDVTCRLGGPTLECSALFAAFERQDDAPFESTLDGALGAGHLGLDALLPEDRSEAIRWLTPDPVGGAARREFLDRWASAMAQLRAGVGGDECLELMEQAARHKLTADRLPWSFVARGKLKSALESLLAGADDAALARGGRWLEAFERAGMHVDVWELQHLFWAWRRRLAERPTAFAERRLAAAFGEKLGFSDSVLTLEASA